MRAPILEHISRPAVASASVRSAPRHSTGAPVATTCSPPASTSARSRHRGAAYGVIPPAPRSSLRRLAMVIWRQAASTSQSHIAKAWASHAIRRVHSTCSPRRADSSRRNADARRSAEGRSRLAVAVTPASGRPAVTLATAFSRPTTRREHTCRNTTSCFRYRALRSRARRNSLR